MKNEYERGEDEREEESEREGERILKLARESAI